MTHLNELYDIERSEAELFSLTKYREQVVRPMIIERIRSGRLDAALNDPATITIICRDPETMKAAEDRLIELARLDRE